MTIRERALERLIGVESVKIRFELIHKYRAMLNELNKRITTEEDTVRKHISESDIKEYNEIATKLHKLINTNDIAFLDAEYFNL
jgi:hypothetical protein